MPTAGSQPNQSLADGLLCLQAIAATREPVGVRELARQLGLHHVKTNRMLMGLAAAGFAQRNERGHYSPGPALHVLAALATFSSGLLATALPHLEALHQATTGKVALGVRWRDQVCYLYWGTHTNTALGRTALHPATRSSIGMVLLAAATAEDITSCYPDDIPDFTDRKALDAALRRIRRDRYARLKHGSGKREHWSIAVGLGDPAHAALAVTSIPLDADVTAILGHLRASADAIAESAP